MRRKPFFFFIIPLATIFLAYGGYSLLLQEKNSVRVLSADEQIDKTWATPVKNNHLENFHKVSESLYRGAQPTQEGMKELQRLGIKTVVNLRELHSDRDELAGTNLTYFHIKTTAIKMKMHEVDDFLKIMADKNNWPVFVHCQHGSDRTGTMCAFYRMVFEGWSKDDAIREMTEGGFGFHEIWRMTLLPFIQDADVAALRNKYHPTHNAAK